MSDDTSWFDSFPPEVQEWNEVKESTDMAGFLERMGNHRKHLGQSIRMPSKEASSEDLAAFHDKLAKGVPGLMPTPQSDDADAMKAVLTKLGLPADIEGYEDVSGEGLMFNDGQLASIKALALNAGLTRTQFKALAEQIGVKTTEDHTALTDAQKATEDALKQEWGMTAEDKLKEVEGFLRQSSAPQNLIDALSNKDLDADTTQWLNKLAQGVGEGSQMDKQGNMTEAPMLTPYEATQRIDEMLNNKDHPYHKGEVHARTRMRELMAMKNAA